MTFRKNCLHHLCAGPQWAGIILFLTVLSFSLPSQAQEINPAYPCIEKLQNPSLKNIDCILRFNLDDGTRSDLNGTTAGVIRDAACKVKVSIGREEIFTALLNEKILEVPRQPVACQILTNGKPLLAQFTMAPKLWFAGGKAVQLKPEMGKVSGLPDLLGALLTNWVNSSKMIESAMLKEVNAILEKGLPS